MSLTPNKPRNTSGLENPITITEEKLFTHSESLPPRFTRPTSVSDNNSLINSQLKTMSVNPFGPLSTSLTESLVMPALDPLSEHSPFPESTPSELNPLIKPETQLKDLSQSPAETEDLNPLTKSPLPTKFPSSMTSRLSSDNKSLLTSNFSMLLPPLMMLKLKLLPDKDSMMPSTSSSLLLKLPLIKLLPMLLKLTLTEKMLPTDSVKPTKL